MLPFAYIFIWSFTTTAFFCSAFLLILARDLVRNVSEMFRKLYRVVSQSEAWTPWDFLQFDVNFKTHYVPHITTKQVSILVKNIST